MNERIKEIVKTAQQSLQPRIGTTLMKPIRARIGRPTDDAVWVTDGNLPDYKQVYIHLVTDGDALSWSTALLGGVTRKDVYLNRSVEIKRTESGFYSIIGFSDVEDAIFTEGIEELDDQSPVLNHQLVEQATLHPTGSGIVVRISPGLLGTDWYSGADTADFSSGTVQDTTPANITIPTTNGQSKAVLIQIDSSTSTLEYKQSSEFSSTLSLIQAYKAGLLSTVDADRDLLGYLKLTAGMTTLSSYADLWSAIPRAGGGSTAPFDDATAIVKGSADATKLLRFEVDGITTGTTRVITVPDSDVTIPAVPIGGSTGATDNAILRADGTGGSTAQGSGATIDDNGAITATRQLSVNGTANEIQVLAKQHSTQTTPVIAIHDSSNNIVHGWYADGKFTANFQSNSAGDFQLFGNSKTMVFIDAGTEQAGIGTATPGTDLFCDIVDTDFAGALGIPYGTTSERTALSPRDGAFFYDTTLDLFYGTQNGAWVRVSTLYTSVAIIADEKTQNTAGGGSSATTWNARDLNTEIYDPDAIVSISSNQFTPISGDYEIDVIATGHGALGLQALRLYNVTQTSVAEVNGLNGRNISSTDVGTVTLSTKFTANGTDAYRIDHYTAAAVATNGLGFPLNLTGRTEQYMVITLRKFA